MRWRISRHHRTELMPLDATTGITEALLTSVSLTGRYNTSHTALYLLHIIVGILFILDDKRPTKFWRFNSASTEGISQTPSPSNTSGACARANSFTSLKCNSNILSLHFLRQSTTFRPLRAQWPISAQIPILERFFMAAIAESGCQYGAGKG